MYASIIHNYQFIMLITMIHVFYKLLEIYHNILFFYLLYIELQNCSVKKKRVYNNILSYNNKLEKFNVGEGRYHITTGTREVSTAKRQFLCCIFICVIAFVSK